jgi:methylmalonyl-CoA/ethylmalonyl-CoA epimerase
MINGIGHIGIVVADLEEAINEFSRAFGLPKPEIITNKKMKKRIALLTFTNGTSLELIHDFDETGQMKNLQKERGDFIHHFSVNSDDIQADIDTLKSCGIAIQDHTPRQGVRGKQIAFTDKDALGGVRCELSE